MSERNNNEKFLKRVQWNGFYATDFHQDFTTTLAFMMLIEYDGRRDYETEQDILRTVSGARTYKSYFEQRVKVYNSVHENGLVEIDSILREAYGQRGVELDLKVDGFRSLVNGSVSEDSFFHINTTDVIESAVRILTLMMPSSHIRYSENCAYAKQMVYKYKQDVYEG